MYQEHLNDSSKERMSDPPQSIRRNIFRSEALEHFRQNQERIELPRLISSRLFRFLWAITILLMLLGSLIVFWPMITEIW